MHRFPTYLFLLGSFDVSLHTVVFSVCLDVFRSTCSYSDSSFCSSSLSTVFSPSGIVVKGDPLLPHLQLRHAHHRALGIEVRQVPLQRARAGAHADPPSLHRTGRGRELFRGHGLNISDAASNLSRSHRSVTALGVDTLGNKKTLACPSKETTTDNLRPWTRTKTQYDPLLLTIAAFLPCLLASHRNCLLRCEVQSPGTLTMVVGLVADTSMLCGGFNTAFPPRADVVGVNLL